MQRLRFAILFLCAMPLWLPLAAAGQAASGSIGIFDDSTLTRDSGDMAGPVKDLYVGVAFDAGAAAEMTGLEFSISGLEGFVVVYGILGPQPSVVLGTPAAPADTTTGTGGMNIAWPMCVLGDRVFMKLTLASPHPPRNRVLQARRRYPPSTSDFPFSLATGCDMPCFCVTRLRGGTYTLNPGAGTASATWTAIKTLYK